MGSDGTAPAPEKALVLYCSRRSWGLSLIGALVLVVGPVVVAVNGSLGGLGIGALVVGVIATAALLFDQPTRSIVTSAGIERRCPLKRRALEWAEIDSLERLRRSGGLVAKVGRRRLVLCDRGEGHLEHIRLLEIASDAGTGVTALLEPPELDARPTDLYRRAKS